MAIYWPYTLIFRHRSICRLQRVMSEKAAKFRKTDVTRAVKAVEAAGLTVARVEFDRDGKFSVFTSQEAESHPGQPLDEWLARNARLA
jgi:hypothetical protein